VRLLAQGRNWDSSGTTAEADGGGIEKITIETCCRATLTGGGERKKMEGQQRTVREGVTATDNRKSMTLTMKRGKEGGERGQRLED